MFRTLTIILLTLSLLSCKTSKMASLQSFDNVKTPPGTIQISDNLYFDLTENVNFSWLEYLYWLKRVYGEDSEEYLKAIPNNKVWSELNENYSNFDKYYLRHPAYRDYPVVGISYEQALGYAKWRSDRVMQYSLQRAGIISYQLSENKDSIFTIEKYFNGQYLNYKPDENVKLYPEYSLPDSMSYYKFSQFADSLNARNYKSCKYALSLDEYNCFENKPNRTDSLPYGIDPTMSNLTCREKIVFHLKGNVREMTNVKGVFYGLSFIDSCDTDYNKCRVDNNLVNSYTGFRNICRYKEWGK